MYNTWTCISTRMNQENLVDVGFVQSAENLLLVFYSFVDLPLKRKCINDYFTLYWKFI